MAKKSNLIMQHFVIEKLCSKNVYRCKFCCQLYTRFNVTKMCKHLIKACTKITVEKRKSIMQTMNIDCETGSSIKCFTMDDDLYNFLPVPTEFRETMDEVPDETDNSCYDEPHNSCINRRSVRSNGRKLTANASQLTNSMIICQEPVMNIKEEVTYNILPVSTEFSENDNFCCEEPLNACTGSQLQSSNAGKSTENASHLINSTNIYRRPVVNIKEEEEESDSLCCVSVDYSGAEPEMDSQSLSPLIFENSPSESRNQRKSSQTELIELAIRALKKSGSGERACRPAGPKDADEFDVAGQKMAFDLRNLKPEQRIYAEKLIGDVIFQGKREKLNDYSSVNVLSADPRLQQFPIQSNQNSCTSTLESINFNRNTTLAANN